MRHLVHALLVAAIVVPAANGQQPRPQGKVVQAQFFQGSGTIHSYDAQQINMLTAGNQPWVIKIDEKTAISVKGEGTQEMMRAGSVVRFYAKLNKRGMAIEPIGEITLMTPREGFVPMIEESPEGEEAEGASDDVKKQLRGEQPEKKAEGNAEKKEGDKPEEEKAEGDKEEEKEEEKKPEGRPGAINPFDGIGISQEKEASGGRSGRSRRGGNDAEEDKRYFVVGQLVSARRGKLVVNAGDKTKIKAELADDAEIKVDFTTHAAARKGDTLEVKGYFFEQGEAFANSIEITLAPPKDEDEVLPKRPSRNARREKAEREKEGEEPQEEGVPGFGPRR
jgi:hypothetical protein